MRFKKLIPANQRKVNALVRKQCCNYDNGNCILLDNGDVCPCPQIISFSLNCKWFRTAVLLNDKELYIRLMKPAVSKKCTVCGAEYEPTGRNSKYCDKCWKSALNKQKTEYIKKRGMSVEILSLKNRIKSSIFPFETDKVIYFHYYPQKTA